MTEDQKSEILNSEADITWNFAGEYYVQTDTQKFIFSDPSYYGDGSLTETETSYKDWRSPIFERYMGRKVIKEALDVKSINLLDQN